MIIYKRTGHVCIILFIVILIAGCIPMPEVSPGTYRETLDRIIEDTRDRMNSDHVDPVIVQKSLELTDGSSNQYEALERIYDWVIQNIDYDIEKYRRRTPYYVDPVKTLQTKKGICQDYAQLTRQLLIASGIHSEVKTGEVTTEAGTELHAWNEAKADGVLYALDTTWGSGFLTPDLSQFIKRPVRLFLTSPEELRKLHQNPEYLQEKQQDLMRAEAQNASPKVLPGHEEKMFVLANSRRSQGNLPELYYREDLVKEARHLAEQGAGKMCAGQDWNLDLNDSMKRLNAEGRRVSTLSANVYVYWGFQPASPEQIFNEFISHQQNLGYIMSSDFNSLGIGVVQRGDLLVFCQLLAFLP